MHSPQHVYLDCNASTPLLPSVKSSITEAMEFYGNPSSSHKAGIDAKRIVDESRHHVATLLDAEDSEVVFTSGGTESINWALKSSALASKHRGNHIISSAVEHPAVLKTLEFLRDQHGFEFDLVEVDRLGRVSPEAVVALLRPSTILVTIMTAQNEVGTVQPIRDIFEAVGRECPDAYRHTDASQAVGKIPLSFKELQADMLTVAGHKLYAPKGVGALLLSKRVCLPAFIHGAGHEGGRRAGTENVLLVAGLGTACKEARENMDSRVATALELRELLWESLVKSGVDAVRNSPVEDCLPNTLSVGFRGAQAPLLVHKLKDTVAISAGAACHSGSIQCSATLKCMNVPEEIAIGTVRLSLGCTTTKEEILWASERIVDAVRSCLAPPVPAEDPTGGCLYLQTGGMTCEASATVVAAEQCTSERDPEVRLYLLTDRTVFHPQGGGQPSDVGEIAVAGCVFAVRFARRASPGQVAGLSMRFPHNAVCHFGFWASEPCPDPVGRAAKLSVDPSARKLHAMLHTGGHLLDTAMQNLGVTLPPGKGYHFPASGKKLVPFVEYVGQYRSAADLSEPLQAEISRLAALDTPVHSEFVPAEELALWGLDAEEVVRGIPGGGPYRVVRVGDGPAGVCGGTHLSSCLPLAKLRVGAVGCRKKRLKVRYGIEK